MCSIKNKKLGDLKPLSFLYIHINYLYFFFHF
nr:MAG TPA: hypothetical protein [Caudoviricetes sp.]